MQDKRSTAGGQSQPAESTSQNAGSACRDELRLRWQSTLRAGLACGMGFCVLLGILDTFYLPQEWLPLTVSLRIAAVFSAFAAALAASYIERLQSHIDLLVTALLFLASAGIGSAAIVSAAAGNVAAFAESVLVVLGIYLLAGLPLRHSVVAAAPALAACLVLGQVLDIGTGAMVYGALFIVIANLIGAAACAARENDGRAVVESSRKLTGLINTDRLTGIYNRQMFDDHLSRIWKQSRRERHNLGLLIVDIDHMREFNKRYGHPEGDRCIQRVGEALKNSVRRPLDFVARYDGSKFALVLYDPPTAYIRRFVLNVQTSIAGLHIPNEGSPIGPRVTVSIGAVVLGPQTTKSLEGAVQFAEEALSASKLRGRDRAVVFQSSDLENPSKPVTGSLSASA